MVAQHEGRDANPAPLLPIVRRRVVGDPLEPRHAFLGAGLLELEDQRLGAVGRLAEHVEVLGGLPEPLEPLPGAMLQDELGDVGEDPRVLGERAVEPGRPREDQAEDPVGITEADVQRDRRAHRDAADDGAGQAEVIHQRDQVVGGRGERDLLRVAQRAGLSVPARVETDQAEARRRREEAERLGHVAAEPVLEEQGNPAADVPVVEIQAVVGEVGHQLGPRGEECISFSRRKATLDATCVSARPCRISGPS